uniref:Lysozyme like 6 n=1 Tax=Theropithecus gelada TaxID=9565 RepID=A0A8D2FKB2_THEGE
MFILIASSKYCLVILHCICFVFSFCATNKQSVGRPYKIMDNISRLCLAFVESKFNISKINENADGSFDYGLFQINGHYWCNDYKSHSENLCQVDCQDLLNPNLLAGIHCAKRIVSGARGMNNWVEWRLHCSGRPLSYWLTGCRLG